MENASASDLDARLVRELLDAHGHIVLGLVHETLLELASAHDVTLAADERARAGLEDDGEGRRVNLDRVKLDGVLRIGVDVTDVGAVDAHDSGDVTGADLLALGAAEVVEGEELLDGGLGARAVVLDDEDAIAVVNGAGVDAADADAAHILGVVDRHALHGQRGVDIGLGSGHVVDNHVKERVHVVVVIRRVEAGVAVHRARVDDVLHGKLELLVRGAEVGHEVEAVVVGLLGVCARAVDLVDDDHDGEATIDGVTKHEARLGHRALEGVDEQQGAVGHLEDALDLAAEVSVARGVEDVDLDALVLDGDVLGEDGDAALALLVVGVKHAVLDLLVLAEGVGGAQELVNDGRFTVVDVGDDGDVA